MVYRLTNTARGVLEKLNSRNVLPLRGLATARGRWSWVSSFAELRLCGFRIRAYRSKGGSAKV